MNATLGGNSKRSSIGGAGFNGTMTVNQPNNTGIPLHTTRDRTPVRPVTLNATVAGDRDGMRLSQSGVMGRPPMISTNSSSSRSASFTSTSVPNTPPSPTAGPRRMTRTGSFSSVGSRGESPNHRYEAPVWPSAGSVLSLEAIRTACEDAHWSTRLKAFEVINELLTNALTSKAQGQCDDALGSPTSSSSSSRKESFTSLAPNIEGIIEISVAHFGDAHQKVAVEAMSVLGVCVEGYSALSFGKLGVLLSALFNRLADRRAQIK